MSGVRYPNRQALIDAGVAPETVDRAIAESVRRERGGARGGTNAPAHTPGVMNYTEARFSALVADGRWPYGTVVACTFEAETLRLSPDMTFTPDFRLDLDDGSIEHIDVKGAHTFEDSIIKGKAAAVLYPDRRFYIAKLVNRREWRIRRLGVAKRRTIKVII